MHTEVNNSDIGETVLVNLMKLKHRLNFMSKIQVMSGEELKKEELSAIFESFSEDMDQIISIYEKIV